MTLISSQCQGWEFAHSICEWIARFFAKKLRMSNSLKKMSDSLIFGELPEQFAQVRSFLVSDLSKLLTLAHVW